MRPNRSEALKATERFGPLDTLLYATNFHAGTVDVFDTQFQLVPVPGKFTDPDIPDSYAPFRDPEPRRHHPT